MRPSPRHIQLKLDAVVPEGMDPVKYEIDLLWELEKYLHNTGRHSIIWVVPLRTETKALRSDQPTEE